MRQFPFDFQREFGTENGRCVSTQECRDAAKGGVAKKRADCGGSPCGDFCRRAPSTSSTSNSPTRGSESRQAPAQEIHRDRVTQGFLQASTQPPAERHTIRYGGCGLSKVSKSVAQDLPASTMLGLTSRACQPNDATNPGHAGGRRPASKSRSASVANFPMTRSLRIFPHCADICG